LSFFDCIKKRIGNNEALVKRLYSLIIFGSYIRGDFIEGVSDLDFFAVFNDCAEESIPKLVEILKECTQGIKCKLIDLPCVNINDLRDPLKQKNPLKFLTFYQEDFLKNHKVVYGEDISDILPSYGKKTLQSARAEQLIRAPQRFKDNPELLLLSAGETARFEAIINGSNSISKVDIMKTLEKIGDEEALHIYSAYIEGKEIEFSREYLSSFIVSRISKFLENRSQQNNKKVIR
jgi:predicted nucleotidyltransferase